MAVSKLMGDDPHQGGIKNPVAVAWGSAAFASGSAAITTGLSTVVAFEATPVLTAAPTAETFLTHDGGTGGVVTVYGWKPSAAGTTTLIAGTGTDAIRWFAIGTV